MKKIYDVLDIASLKLQKLLYFIQKNFSLSKNKPCNESIAYDERDGIIIYSFNAFKINNNQYRIVKINNNQYKIIDTYNQYKTVKIIDNNQFKIVEIPHKQFDCKNNYESN